VADQDVTTWLLSEEDPSVRFLTLTELLQRPPDDPEVRAARRAVASSAVVQRIFAAQNPDGSWCSPKDTYRPKYRSTLWQVLILAELAVDGRDERIAAAVENHILPYLEEVTSGLQRIDIHCLMGYSLFFLHRLGYGDHPITLKFGELTVSAYGNRGWPCQWASRPDCSWGMIKLLRGLAAVPTDRRPPDAAALIERLARGLLAHRFWFEEPLPDHPYVTNRDWLKFGFPLFYQSDLLEMLLALQAAGCTQEPRYRELAQVVAGQRGEDGRWALGRGFNREMHAPIETVGAPSRWITLRALSALK